jgi:histone H3/H4
MSSRVRSEEDELRAALQVAVAQICTSQEDGGAPMTRSAIQTLTELTYLYATTSLANDLVAFSVHANRRTIVPDDVLLVARKNEELLTKLKDYASSTNLLPVVAPAVSKSSTTASTALRPRTSLNARTASKNSSPQRRHHTASLSSSSSSSSSSPKTTTMALSRHHRELRQRMLNGTDSERSSDDEDSVPLIRPSKKENKNGPVSNSTIQKRPFASSSKRKYIESSDDDDDDNEHNEDAPPIVTKRNNQNAIAATTTMPIEDFSAQLSSGEDSMDF